MRTNNCEDFVADIHTTRADHAAPHCYTTQRIHCTLYSADTNVVDTCKHKCEPAVHTRGNGLTSKKERIKGPATQNAVCRSGLRSLSAAECYILSRLF